MVLGSSRSARISPSSVPTSVLSRTRSRSRTNSSFSKWPQMQARTETLFLPEKKAQASKTVSQRCWRRVSQRTKLFISYSSWMELAFMLMRMQSEQQQQRQASAVIAFSWCVKLLKWAVGCSHCPGASWLLQRYEIISLIYIMSSGPKTRIRIFDYWQIQEPSLESEPSVRRSGESYLADDLVAETQRIVSNVEEFLEGKGGFEAGVGRVRAQVEDLLQSLHLACNCEAEEEGAAEANLKVYGENLRKLYIALREAKLLLHRLQQHFQTANLPNYDRKATQLAFTEPSAVMRQRLQSSLGELRRAMHLLLEAQRLKDSGKELSSIFGRESSPEYCLSRLQELLAHPNIVKLHFLMLFQLEEVESLADQLRQLTAVAEGEYLKYELVLDCLHLMHNEAAEMRAQLQEAERDLEEACSRPAETDARALALQGEARAESWRANRLIYQANLENFTRANVETDMYYYSELKAQFVAQLDEFVLAAEQHRPRHASLIYLLDRQGLLGDLRRRAELLRKVGEADRKLALTIYNQTSSHALPADCRPLAALKEGLLAEIELFLVNNGIAYNKRAREQLPLESDLKKYQDVIAQIQSLPHHQQYASISSRIQVINASAFELETLLSDKQRLGKGEGSALENKVRTASSLRLALLYASALGSSSPMGERLRECERVRERQGFEDMPVKFQATVFNYINDLRTIEDSRQRDDLSSLEKVVAALKESPTQSKLKGNIDSILEKEFAALKEAWFALYHGYLRKISAYGQELLLDRVGELCSAIAAGVKGVLPEQSQLIDSRMDIDRKSFFTHRVLGELAQLASNPAVKAESLRIVNVMRTLEEVFQALDRGFVDKSTGGKIGETVKLFLLEDYLRKAYGQGNLWRAVRTIRSSAYLQSVAEMYPSAPLPKTAVLQALLQIQLQMNAATLVLPQRDQLAAALAEKVPPLLKEMRRFQLTLAARHDVSGFVAVFRYGEIMQQLQQVVGRSGVLAVARVFVCVHELRSARKAVEERYESYENVVVKQNKSIEQYFEKARTGAQGRVEGTGKEVQLVLRCFLNRGESVSLGRAVEALVKKG